MRTLIKNGIIVNEGLSVLGSLLIEDKRISKVILSTNFASEAEYNSYIETIDNCNTVDATGQHIIPGVIDDQVHFREPGNTAKATIASESAAAVLGGVTSFMLRENRLCGGCSRRSPRAWLR